MPAVCDGSHRRSRLFDHPASGFQSAAPFQLGIRATRMHKDASPAGKAARLGACAAMSCFGEMSLSKRPAAEVQPETRFPDREHARCGLKAGRRR
ncbi:hypothetical protein MPLA_1360040 [Mesorhizobium sp. ORS 3359]|nr:hypothetical protein MPLA_1360040 [Mesorhizobium sp. ORS 3359]